MVREHTFDQNFSIISPFPIELITTDFSSPHTHAHARAPIRLCSNTINFPHYIECTRLKSPASIRRSEIILHHLRRYTFRSGIERRAIIVNATAAWAYTINIARYAHLKRSLRLKSYLYWPDPTRVHENVHRFAMISNGRIRANARAVLETASKEVLETLLLSELWPFHDGMAVAGTIFFFWGEGSIITNELLT